MGKIVESDLVSPKYISFWTALLPGMADGGSTNGAKPFAGKFNQGFTMKIEKLAIIMI